MCWSRAWASDVDNGPEYLVYDDNAALYDQRFLAQCADGLSFGGVVAIWSADPTEELCAALDAIFADVQCVDVPVRLGQRQSTYTLLVGSKRPTAEPKTSGLRDTVEG